MTEQSKARWKQRFKVVALTGGCAVAPIVPFYTTFVIQNLWNWFVADALHAATISYWQAFGVFIVFSLLTYKPPSEYKSDTRWKRAFSMMEAIVPEEELTILNERFSEEDQSWTAIISLVGHDLGKAIIGTTCLIVGWVVHTFLM